MDELRVRHEVPYLPGDGSPAFATNGLGTNGPEPFVGAGSRTETRPFHAWRLRSGDRLLANDRQA